MAVDCSDEVPGAGLGEKLACLIGVASQGYHISRSQGSSQKVCAAGDQEPQLRRPGPRD